MNWYAKIAQHQPDTALLVIDMQNDFVNGPISVPNGVKVISSVQAAIADAKSKGIPVIYTAHVYDSKMEGKTPYCIRDTFGSQFVSELGQIDGPVFEKQQYSGFSGVHSKDSSTNLEQHLKAHGIKKVIIVGLALDYCVMHTALEAKQKGFQVVVQMSASKGYGEDQPVLDKFKEHGVNVDESSMVKTEDRPSY